MGRPPGSRNKKIKEDAAIPAPKRGRKPAEAKPVITGATPTTGHNSSMTDDQRRKLLMTAVGKIEPLLTKMASVSGEIRAAYKVAKSGGVAKADIDLAIKLQKMDEADVKAFFETRHTVLRYIWPHFAEQADLFGANRMPAVDRAFEEGKSAGMAAGPYEPPYGKGTPQAESWRDGYKAGQAVNLNGISQLETERDVRPTFLRAVEEVPPPEENVH